MISAAAFGLACAALETHARSVERAQLLEALVDLARSGGLEVRLARASRDAELPAPRSDVCRVRDRVWVVLSGADPLDARIDVLAGAIRTHAGWLLAERYLPPALRVRLGDEDFA